MRKVYIVLLMVTLATASFVVGRSTSGHAPTAALTSESVASIDRLHVQSVSGNPAEAQSNFTEAAAAPTDQPSSFHGYLVFPSNQ